MNEQETTPKKEIEPHLRGATTNTVTSTSRKDILGLVSDALEARHQFSCAYDPDAGGYSLSIMIPPVVEAAIVVEESMAPVSA